MERPSKVGLYRVRCGETEGGWYHVAVTNQMGRLMVHDPGIGVYGLGEYHDGLTKIEWEHLA